MVIRNTTPIITNMNPDITRDLERDERKMQAAQNHNAAMKRIEREITMVRKSIPPRRKLVATKGDKVAHSVTSLMLCDRSFPITMRRGERFVIVTRSNVRSAHSCRSALNVPNGTTMRQIRHKQPISDAKNDTPDTCSSLNALAPPKNAISNPTSRLRPNV